MPIGSDPETATATSTGTATGTGTGTGTPTGTPTGTGTGGGGDAYYVKWMCYDYQQPVPPTCVRYFTTDAGAGAVSCIEAGCTGAVSSKYLRYACNITSNRCSAFLTDDPTEGLPTFEACITSCSKDGLYLRYECTPPAKGTPRARRRAALPQAITASTVATMRRGLARKCWCPSSAKSVWEATIQPRRRARRIAW